MTRNALEITPEMFKVMSGFSKEDRLAFFDMMSRYHFLGEVPEGKEQQLGCCFELVKPQIAPEVGRTFEEIFDEVYKPICDAAYGL